MSFRTIARWRGPSAKLASQRSLQRSAASADPSQPRRPRKGDRPPYPALPPFKNVHRPQTSFARRAVIGAPTSRSEPTTTEVANQRFRPTTLLGPEPGGRTETNAPTASRTPPGGSPRYMCRQKKRTHGRSQREMRSSPTAGRSGSLAPPGWLQALAQKAAISLGAPASFLRLAQSLDRHTARCQDDLFDAAAG
jgi:hypothetical protein